MKVCETCGAFLVLGDTEKRTVSHMEGKQHQGFAQIRKTLDEYRVCFFFFLLPFFNNEDITSKSFHFRTKFVMTIELNHKQKEQQHLIEIIEEIIATKNLIPMNIITESMIIASVTIAIMTVVETIVMIHTARADIKNIAIEIVLTHKTVETERGLVIITKFPAKLVSIAKKNKKTKITYLPS